MYISVVWRHVAGVVSVVVVVVGAVVIVVAGITTGFQHCPTRDGGSTLLRKSLNERKEFPVSHV